MMMLSGKCCPGGEGECRKLCGEEKVHIRTKMAKRDQEHFHPMGFLQEQDTKWISLAGPQWHRDPGVKSRSLQAKQ